MLCFVSSHFTVILDFPAKPSPSTFTSVFGGPLLGSSLTFGAAFGATGAVNMKVNNSAAAVLR